MRVSILRAVAFAPAAVALALLSFAFANKAHAGELAVSWTLATQYEDSTPLPTAHVAGVRVEWSLCGGTATAPVFGTKLGEVLVAPPTLTTTIANLPGSTTAYCVRAYTKLTAALGGVESAPTGVVSKVVPFALPKPPTITTVVPR